MDMIPDTTPLAMLTVADLRAIMAEARNTEERKEPAEARRMVYGLQGIADLFGVSVATAWRYKETVIAGAVSQRGRTIITDAERALELFRETKEK